MQWGVAKFPVKIKILKKLCWAIFEQFWDHQDWNELNKCHSSEMATPAIPLWPNVWIWAWPQDEHGNPDFYAHAQKSDNLITFSSGGPGSSVVRGPKKPHWEVRWSQRSGSRRNKWQKMLNLAKSFRGSNISLGRPKTVVFQILV